MSCGWDSHANIAQAGKLRARSGHARGARIILVAGAVRDAVFLHRAGRATSRWRSRCPPMQAVRLVSQPRAPSWGSCCGKLLEALRPVCFKTPSRSSTADGQVLGIYRKAPHSPTARSYRKDLLRARDTGFRVWNSAYGRHRVGTAWDQWVSGTARVHGVARRRTAAVPTAIGSEPPPAWRSIPAITGSGNPSRVKRRRQPDAADRGQSLWSGALAAGPGRTLHPLLRILLSSPCHGARVAGGSEAAMRWLVASFRSCAIAAQRDNWYVFRDRRPDLYGPLCRLGGPQ